MEYFQLSQEALEISFCLAFNFVGCSTGLQATFSLEFWCMFGEILSIMALPKILVVCKYPIPNCIEAVVSASVENFIISRGQGCGAQCELWTMFVNASFSIHKCSMSSFLKPHHPLCMFCASCGRLSFCHMFPFCRKLARWICSLGTSRWPVPRLGLPTRLSDPPSPGSLAQAWMGHCKCHLIGPLRSNRGRHRRRCFARHGVH